MNLSQLVLLKTLKYYAILMKYQWPMSTASFAQMNKDEIIELTTQKKPAAEEEFIRNRLEAIDPNLYLVFIPTIAYELFFLYYYHKIKKGGEKKIFLAECSGISWFFSIIWFKTNFD